MSDAEDRLRLMGLSVGAELATLMVELFGGGGGQMQTPWEQDIDGAQYSLGNVSHIGILNNDEEIDPVFRIEQTVTYDQPYSAPIDSQCSASIQYFPSADMGSGETSFPTGFFVNTDAQSVLQAATGHTTITGGYFLTGCTGPSPGADFDNLTSLQTYLGLSGDYYVEIDNAISLSVGGGIDNATAHNVWGIKVDWYNFFGATTDKVIGLEIGQLDAPLGDVWGIMFQGQVPSEMGPLRIGTSYGSIPMDDWVQLDCAFPNKAILLPRLDTAARNAMTPQEGMLIYNTDSKFLEFYNGTTWA